MNAGHDGPAVALVLFIGATTPPNARRAGPVAAFNLFAGADTPPHPILPRPLPPLELSCPRPPLGPVILLFGHHI